MASPESMEPHAALKERIIFGALENKIAVTRNILNRALTMRGENIDAQLDDLWMETLSSVPEDEDRFMEFKRLEDEDHKLTEESRQRETLGTSSLDDQDLDNGEDEGNRQKHEAEAIRLVELKIENENRQKDLHHSDKNHSIEFLTNIELLIKNLKRKHKQVEILSTPRERMSEKAVLVMKKFFRRTLTADDIIETRLQDPFTIVLFIKPERFEKMRGKTVRGAFYEGTPYCLIKAGIKGADSTIAHERVHALADGVIQLKNPNKTLISDLDRIDKISKMPSGESVAQAFSKGQVHNMLDMLHGEMIAVGKQAIDKNFGRSRAYENETPEGKLLRALGFGQQDFEFNRFIDVFSTAGQQTAGVLATIDAQREKYKDSPKMLELVNQIGENFKKEFLVMATGVEKAARVIDTMPAEMQADAKEELITLLCFLPPTKFRHAPDYMRAWSRAQKSSQQGA